MIEQMTFAEEVFVARVLLLRNDTHAVIRVVNHMVRATISKEDLILVVLVLTVPATPKIETGSDHQHLQPVIRSLPQHMPNLEYSEAVVLIRKHSIVFSKHE